MRTLLAAFLFLAFVNEAAVAAHQHGKGYSLVASASASTKSKGSKASK